MNSFKNFLRRAVLAVAACLAVPVAAGVVTIGSATSVEAAVVSSISVRGNQRVEAATIKTYITIKPGQSYGAADVDESVKILYGTGLFSDVNIGRSGSVLIVSVAENPIVASVAFEGNKKIKTNILSQVVNLAPREVLTEAKLQSDIRRIEGYYARNGRSSVQVDPSVTDIGNNRVTVVFFIVEGDRTGIGSIDFVGNEAFSKSRLRRVIRSRKTNFMSWLSKNDIFSEERLAADQELLRRHYLKFGYADFQVLAAESSFDAVSGKYHLVFTIEEGPKYRFGEIAVDSSIPGVDSDALRRVLTTRTGSTFNADKVEKSVERMAIELSRAGFVFAQVQPRGDRNYVDNVIDITYVVDEGPRTYIERIDIRGNTKTRDYVIRREFDISEGDAYNRVLVDKAQRRLRELDFFEFVNITTEPGSALDKVVVAVNLADKSTGSISAAVGVSTSDGLIGEIALEERNFLGRGQNLRIAVGGGLNDRTFNVSFTEPFFMGNRMSAGIDVFRNASTAGIIRPYAITSTGGGLRLGLPLSDETQLDFRYNIRSDTVSGSTAVPAAGPFANGTRLTSSVGYSLSYSTLDSMLDPREGVHVVLTQDVAGLGGDARYLRSTVKARYYRPIIPDADFIAMLKASAGNITGIGQSVSPYDNFYKGGETVRGFATYGYGPRDTTSGFAVGGKNHVSGTAEVQFPLPGLPPDFGLRGAAFADAGILTGVDPTAGGTIVSDTIVRTSVGGSVVWASPFGVLRLDLAVPLTKASYDKTQFLRFGAGATF